MNEASDLPTAEGTLTELPMAELLARLDRQGFSGTLEVTAANRRNLAVLEAGRAAKVQLAVPIERLGRLLVEWGVVDAAQLESLAARQTAAGGRLGDLLVASGAVDRATVDRALADQLRRRLLRLFLLPEASWRLMPATDLLAERGAAPQTLDLQAVLAEGVRTSHSVEALEGRMAEVLAGRTASAAAADPALDRLQLTLQEQSACRYLARGAWDVGVFRAVPAEHRHTLLVAAYCLHVTGRLTYTAAPAAQLPTTRLSPAQWPSIQPPAARPPSNQPPAEERPSVQPAPPSRPSTGPGADEAPAETGGEAAPTAAPEGFEREICELHERLAQLSHYELLGVAPDVGADGLKNAYLERVKRYHPDRAIRHGLIGHRDKLETILLQIREAFETLNVPETRAKYDARLGGRAETTAEQVGQLVDRALAGERAYQMAVMLERQHRLDEAQQQADEALRLQPEQGEFVCMSLWLQACRRAARASVSDLVPRMLEAATLVPQHERAQMQAARLLQRAGREAEALEHFHKVLKLNPQNLDALREIRLRTMRQAKQQGPAPAGLFGRLFGKKDK